MWLQKMYDDKFFSPLSFVAVFRSEIRDPGLVKIRIRDPGQTSRIRNTACMHDLFYRRDRCTTVTQRWTACRRASISWRWPRRRGTAPSPSSTLRSRACSPAAPSIPGRTAPRSSCSSTIPEIRPFSSILPPSGSPSDG
jgi:hypothetical protein